MLCFAATKDEWRKCCLPNYLELENYCRIFHWWIRRWALLIEDLNFNNENNCIFLKIIPIWKLIIKLSNFQTFISTLNWKNISNFPLPYCFQCLLSSCNRKLNIILRKLPISPLCLIFMSKHSTYLNLWIIFLSSNVYLNLDNIYDRKYRKYLKCCSLNNIAEKNNRKPNLCKLENLGKVGNAEEDVSLD